jgi:excisionase family DNA binding protein
MIGKEELLTPQELASRLKVGLGWVYAQTRQKGDDAIPRIKCGKYLRFSERDVSNWLERQQD